METISNPICFVYQEIKVKFFHVNKTEVFMKTNHVLILNLTYRYWILKRKASGNKPLLTPREEEEKSGVTPQGEDTEKDKKMLVNIRQVC